MPKVFLSYASEDRERVQQLSKRLQADGFDVWRDSEQLLPGDDWEREILDALSKSDAAVVCISPRSIAKTGYVQKEWRKILEAADRIPLDRNFLIPVRLEECELPFRFRHLHRADLFADQGYEQLCQSLRTPHFEPEITRLYSISNVPSTTVHFRGRQDLLDRIRQNLFDPRVGRVALSGLAGIGKTQLAWRYAEDHAADYWIRWHLECDPSPAAGLVALAQRLDLPEAKQPTEEITIAATLNWLRTNDGWLLIFENAESPSALNRYLPGRNGHVLIASRNPNWGSVAEPISVEKWDKDESVSFLLERTRQEDRGAAAKIAEQLDGLPLTLEQAAAYVEATGGTLSHYENLLRSHAPALLAKYPPPDYARDAAATFALTFERLEQYSPSALELLNIFAFLGPDDIPESLLDRAGDALPESLRGSWSNELEHDSLLAALRRFSLVQRAEGGLWMHRVVQILLRARLEAAADTDWGAVTLHVLAAALHYDRYDSTTWPDARRLEPHALAALRNAGGDTAPEARIELTYTLGWMALHQGHAQEAQSLGEEALGLSRRILGGEHRATLLSMSIVGAALSARGSFPESKEMLQTVMDRSGDLFGEDDSYTLTATNNLAGVLADLGDLPTARKLQENVLAARKRLLGVDNPSTLAAMNNLAGTLRLQGELASARSLYEEVIATSKRTLNPEHPNTVAAMNNLGNVMVAQGASEAHQILVEVVRLREKVEGMEHPATLTAKTNLGEALRRTGALDDAEQLQREVLNTQIRVIGAEHPDTLHSMHNLAATMHAQKHFTEARELEEKVLAIRVRVLGAHHTDTTISAWGLLGTLMQIGANYPARALARTHLVWLEGADEALLSGDQKRIRNWIREARQREVFPV